MSQQFPPQGYQAPLPSPQEFNGKKIAAGVCGILIGAFGVHKFILGLTTSGLVMLLVTILTCGVGGFVMHIIGLVEGIMYLTKSDEQFYQEYAVQKKGWF
jgi:TM2 domain-containing membrane protein YozV